MKRKQMKGPCYSTDVTARNIWLSLLRDFRTTLGRDFGHKAESAFLEGLPQFREYEFPKLGNIPASRFKRYKQMQDLLKKYRFAKDAYSDDELHNKTLRKYFAEQERIASFKPLSMTGLMVVQEARAVARTILGSYKPEEAVVRCKFGRKSSIGCPLSLAYIDEKLSTAKAFTGSSQCSEWFWEVIKDDPILTQIVMAIGVKPGDLRLKHESLNLINVPKSWKTFRTITPLTLLSLFYSYGIGQLVTERLQKAGIDIQRLQGRHRHLVKSLSRSCTHATADLSAASDSITMELLNRVLPREWHRAIKTCLTHQIQFTENGVVKQAYTESVLPMGNGLTFPVETLMFYCILRAVGNLTGISGIYSVYGDDLIYPSRLHKYVVGIFPQLKLKLNLDKTFVRYPFRESCGSDFYRGSDVRPFYLQGEAQTLTSSKYQAFLYKTINGLMRRWHPLEIRQTLYYLFTELAIVSKEIFRVPPDYPDTAGVKVSEPWDVPLGLENLPWSPIYVSLEDMFGNYRYRYSFLSEAPSRRFVKTVLPYYWLALQGLTDEVDDDYKLSTRPRSSLKEARRSSLCWVKHVRRRRYKNAKGKDVLKKMVSFAPSVSSRTGIRHMVGHGLRSFWA